MGPSSSPCGWSAPTRTDIPPVLYRWTDHPSAGLRLHLDVGAEADKEGGLALCRAISDYVYEQLDLDEVILVLGATDDEWGVQREGAAEACR